MDQKIIRDSLHGYISIPIIICKEIIDTPIFQRLKRIEQTSMRPLYPSAHHDRFVHSIGVYYLGEKALTGLINNIKGTDYYENNLESWNKYGLLFKLACLLHDCAHAPFSHSFEYAYLGARNGDKWNEIKEELKKSIIIPKGDLSLYEYSIDNLFCHKPAPHEVFSAIIVAHKFADNIKTVSESLFPDFNYSVEHIEFIQRAILGMKYDIEGISKNLRNEETQKSSKEIIKAIEHFNILNCLIQLLNSSSFDVDKLDYIIRDSFAAGIQNLSVDVERILSSLTLIETHEYKTTIDLKNEYIDNSVMFSDDYQTKISHAEGGESALNLHVNNVTIEGELIGSIEINDGSFEYTSPHDYSQPISIGKISNFKLQCSRKPWKIKAINCSNVKIIGNFQGSLTANNTLSDTKTKMDGCLNCQISGSFNGGKVIGKINWDNKGTTFYEIGYKQSALSVIADTITARNRLYLWTYAHHKVTYIDYLLRNAVLIALIDKKGKDILQLPDLHSEANDRLENLLNLDIFDKEEEHYLLDDGHFTTMITKDMVNQNEFARKYIDRTKEYSIWKNYAEYNIFFSDLTDKEKERLWFLLFYADEKGHSDINYKEGNVQIFTESILKQYDSGNEYEFVWVKPSGYKMSRIDSEETYLVFKNSSVRRLKDIMHRDITVEEYVGKDYFYLYSSSELDYEKKLDLIRFLKKQVRDYKK